MTREVIATVAERVERSTARPEVMALCPHTDEALHLLS
jgi:hypothetical protein